MCDALQRLNYLARVLLTHWTKLLIIKRFSNFTQVKHNGRAIVVKNLNPLEREKNRVCFVFGSILESLAHDL